MVAKRPYVPCRGHVVWINFSPVRGHEQRGRRPALIVSSEKYKAKSGLALVCPITSQVKGYPFEVALTVKAVAGVLLAAQIRSIDWTERRVKKIGAVSEKPMAEIQDLLRKLIID